MIIATEPQCIDSARYNTNETAKILGLHINTVRRHADEGLIRFGIRKANNRRFFFGHEIKRYWRAQY
ncbi:MAG: helix-turn-helix domain-containing protein [Mangrovibacterium sp.]